MVTEKQLGLADCRESAENLLVEDLRPDDARRTSLSGEGMDASFPGLAATFIVLNRENIR